MSGDWNSFTKSLRPKGFSDVFHGLKKIIKANAIKFDKDTDGELKVVASQIWEAAGEDADLLIKAIDATIAKRGYLSYLYGCLGKEPEPSSQPASQDSPPPDIQTEPPVELEKAIEEVKLETVNGSGDPYGNYCFFNRSLRNHPYLTTVPDWVRVMWDNLIMDAAWKDHEIEWCGRRIMLKRGQWAISIRAIAEERGQNERMVRYWLDNFVKHQMIEYFALIKKIDSNDPWIVAGDFAGHVAGHVAGGVLVTLLNFNKFQAKIDSIVAARVAHAVAGGVALQKNGISKEGKTGEGNLSAQVVKDPKLTATEIFEIWEEEKGPLPSIRIRQPERLSELLKYLNNLVGRSPRESWIEIIHKARQCHESHRAFMSPVFFSKDLSHVDQVMNGLYEKSFERSKYGATKVERAGRGDREEFGIKSRSSRRVRSLDDSEVSDMQ